MTRSYTPPQIADGLLAGEFTRDSAFVPLVEVERLTRERDEARGEVELLREELQVVANSARVLAAVPTVEEINCLRAANKGLRAEVERLRDENATLRRDIDRMTRDRDAQRAAIKEPQP